MPVGSEQNYDFTVAFPKEKGGGGGREKDSCFFFCTASKKNIHKGNILMPDIRRHNQSWYCTAKLLPKKKLEILNWQTVKSEKWIDSAVEIRAKYGKLRFSSVFSLAHSCDTCALVFQQNCHHLLYLFNISKATFLREELDRFVSNIYDFHEGFLEHFGCDLEN